MSKKIGVYICSGCEIGKSLDIEKLCQLASSEQNVAVCKSHKSLCSIEGFNIINNDIVKENLDGLIIAACSPRAKTEVFDFPGNILLERTNIREQVAWCMEPGEEDTQMAAEDYLRMAVTKINNINLPSPFIAENISSDILVVGGGITGITAAIEGAKAGYKVHIIEKEEKLGGWLNKLHKQIPYFAPYNKLIDPEIKNKLKELEQFENIQIHTSTSIQNISGQPGQFNVIGSGTSYVFDGDKIKIISFPDILFNSETKEPLGREWFDRCGRYYYNSEGVTIIVYPELEVPEGQQGKSCNTGRLFELYKQFNC